MIRLTNVSKVFNAGRTNGVTALKGINLSINGEGTVLFQGPSGSGKTTLLNLLGCMSRPTTGRIWIHKTEVSGLSERFLAELRRRYFGFLFQDFQLIHGLSALMNVMLPLYPTALSRPAIRAKAMRVLDALDMASHAPVAVEHLSGGEQQRVAIARALINNPKVLLADEPCANLDTLSSRTVMETLVRLNREMNVTVIFVSHDPEDKRYARNVLMLGDGKIIPQESNLP